MAMFMLERPPGSNEFSAMLQNALEAIRAKFIHDKHLRIKIVVLAISTALRCLLD